MNRYKQLFTETKMVNLERLNKAHDLVKKKSKISKDLGSIRKKGVQLEDTLGEILDYYQIMQPSIILEPTEFMDGRAQLYIHGDISIYTYFARMGVPTVILYFKDVKEWVALRKHLLDKELIR